ncbi:MAG TPA: dienelactone hydrolase family protein, partial [Ferruginibacter sp.]|nr:dienelactone hydrolase [Chitinophagaceae bacterium]HRI25815.1 dienelactone hydrolase family protein [Ferruginibacter sp.]
VPLKAIEAFKKQMDSIGAVYSFKNYPNALHAFSNPAATEMGKKFNLPIAYNAAADTASWNELKVFLKDLFK